MRTYQLQRARALYSRTAVLDCLYDRRRPPDVSDEARTVYCSLACTETEWEFGHCEFVTVDDVISGSLLSTSVYACAAAMRVGGHPAENAKWFLAGPDYGWCKP